MPRQASTRVGRSSHGWVWLGRIEEGRATGTGMYGPGRASRKPASLFRQLPVVHLMRGRTQQY
jgi:hypothetical protein